MPNKFAVQSLINIFENKQDNQLITPYFTSTLPYNVKTDTKTATINRRFKGKVDRRNRPKRNTTAIILNDIKQINDINDINQNINNFNQPKPALKIFNPNAKQNFTSPRRNSTPTVQKEKHLSGDRTPIVEPEKKVSRPTRLNKRFDNHATFNEPRASLDSNSSNSQIIVNSNVITVSKLPKQIESNSFYKHYKLKLPNKTVQKKVSNRLVNYTSEYSTASSEDHGDFSVPNSPNDNLILEEKLKNLGTCKIDENFSSNSDEIEDRNKRAKSCSSERNTQKLKPLNCYEGFSTLKPKVKIVKPTHHLDAHMAFQNCQQISKYSSSIKLRDNLNITANPFRSQNHLHQQVEPKQPEPTKITRVSRPRRRTNRAQTCAIASTLLSTEIKKFQNLEKSKQDQNQPQRSIYIKPLSKVVDFTVASKNNHNQTPQLHKRDSFGSSDGSSGNGTCNSSNDANLIQNYSNRNWSNNSTDSGHATNNTFNVSNLSQMSHVSSNGLKSIKAENVVAQGYNNPLSKSFNNLSMKKFSNYKIPYKNDLSTQNSSSSNYLSQQSSLKSEKVCTSGRMPLTTSTPQITITTSNSVSKLNALMEYSIKSRSKTFESSLNKFSCGKLKFAGNLEIERTQSNCASYDRVNPFLQVKPLKNDECEMENVEDVRDEKLLEKMLEEAKDFEDRKKIRAQLRIVKKKRHDQIITKANDSLHQPASPPTKIEPKPTTPVKSSFNSTTSWNEKIKSKVEKVTGSMGGKLKIKQNSGEKVGRSSIFGFAKRESVTSSKKVVSSVKNETVKEEKSMTSSQTSNVSSIKSSQKLQSPKSPVATKMQTPKPKTPFSSKVQRVQSMPATLANADRKKAFLARLEANSKISDQPKFGINKSKGVRRGASFVVPNATGVKQLLLKWCQQRTSAYENVDITNFSSSWATGLAFCALIHSFFPDSFDYYKLSPSNREQNFELAFSTAETTAQIPRLLEVSDMVLFDKPDYKCVYTYLTEFYRNIKKYDNQRIK